MTMKALYALLALVPFTSFAQTTHVVHVGGSTQGGSDPYYTPQNITIDVGDIVQWVRDNGTHNVNGSTTTFPGNPVSFFSGTPGSPPQGTTTFPWSFTFDEPGVYNYHCDQQGHSATQFGTITVLNTQNVQEQQTGAVSLFPVPTNGMLVVDLSTLDVRTAEVVSIDGRRLISRSVNGTSRLEIGVEELAAGRYFLRLHQADGKELMRSFTKQ